jgi:hypothetical protein
VGCNSGNRLDRGSSALQGVGATILRLRRGRAYLFAIGTSFVLVMRGRCIGASLIEIYRRLDVIEEHYANLKGVTKEIDELREQVRAIEKHLGLNKKIAAYEAGRDARWSERTLFTTTSGGIRKVPNPQLAVRRVARPAAGGTSLRPRCGRST